MKIRNLFLFALVMTFTASLFAQEKSGARLIVKIKKDKSYLFAEATDTTEQVAYRAAKEELDSYIDEYISVSGKADDADYIIVKDIEKYVSKVDIVRGRLYTVFIYVKKNNIIQSKGESELIAISNAPDTLATASEEMEVEETPVKTDEKNPDNPALSPSDSDLTRETSVASVSDRHFLDKLPEYRKEVLCAVMAAKTKFEVADVLAKNYRLHYVKDYGTYSTCKDVTACYWAIETSEGMVVLCPLLNGGGLVNIETGAVTSVGNDEDAVWFRM